jgi:hypothetical protein
MQVFKGLKLKTVLPIVLFAALMTWLLLFVLAAGPFVSIETESASISGNVEVKTDSNASAGSYLSFGTTSTGGGGTGGSSGDAGLIRPVGPQALSCSSISGSVDISPGTNIQSIINSKSAGTKYCLKAGIYKRQTITPKGNDQIIGEKGAVLDGEKVTVYAIRGGGANNVTLKNLIIENYTPEAQKGMIEPESGGWWNIENNEIRNSTAIGLHMGSEGWVVKDNYLHHNEQYGISGSVRPAPSGRDPLVENNEISYSRLHNLFGGGSSSATKWVRSTNLTFLHNWVHDNNGNGFWIDGNNVNTLVEYNKIENHTKSGMFIEISCKTTIRHNYLRNNGTNTNWWFEATGIQNNGSANVEVYNNTLINTGGVIAVDWTRNDKNERCETTSPGVFQARNMSVHDNYIETNRLIMGGLGGGAALTDRNNRYDRNTYVPKNLPEPRYKLGADQITTAQWKAAGQDKNSIWK